MKALLSLLVFVMLAFVASAQDSTLFKIGIDYMLFQSNTEDGSVQTSYYSKGGISLEKPFQFNSLKQVVFSPGLSYKIINENYSGGGLGAGSSSDLNHHTFSGYLKIVHRTNLEKIIPAVFYFGILGGAHIRTWAKGSASSYSKFYNEGNWDNPNYKEDPSHLFNKGYYGILAGIEFSNSTFITPAFELRFMPRYGEYNGNLINPVELSIQLGFGKSKALPEPTE